jgi:hypothetical protein
MSTYKPMIIIPPQTTAYITKSFTGIISNTVAMLGADLSGSESINVQIWASGSYTPLIQYATLSAFPTTGVTNTIYQALDTLVVYYWTGSAYSSNLSGTIWAGGQVESNLLPAPYFAGKWINYIINGTQQGMTINSPVTELSFNDSIILRLVKSVTVNMVGVGVNPAVQIGILGNGE